MRISDWSSDVCSSDLEVVADQPADRQIHVILDNLSTHKKNEDWLAAHPNVTFHFTPTSASWLNQVEIWFGIFQRKTLNNARFQSTEQLGSASCRESLCQYV